jgi:hypothetical protein
MVRWQMRALLQDCYIRCEIGRMFRRVGLFRSVVQKSVVRGTLIRLPGPPRRVIALSSERMMVKVATIGSCVAMALVVAAACGCAGRPEIVPSSGPRPPTDPQSVVIYPRQPPRYELLGTVAVEKDEGAWTDVMGNADEAFDLLRTKAAALGANGLLLDPAAVPHDRRATVGYHYQFYQLGIRGKADEASGVAHAIYVIRK